MEKKVIHFFFFVGNQFEGVGGKRRRGRVTKKKKEKGGEIELWFVPDISINS